MPIFWEQYYVMIDSLSLDINDEFAQTSQTRLYGLVETRRSINLVFIHAASNEIDMERDGKFPMKKTRA